MATLPRRVEDPAVREESHQLVGRRNGMQVTVFAVIEIRVGLPDTLQHRYAERQRLEARVLMLQPVVAPRLPEVAVQRECLNATTVPAQSRSNRFQSVPVRNPLSVAGDRYPAFLFETKWWRPLFSSMTPPFKEYYRFQVCNIFWGIFVFPLFSFPDFKIFPLVLRYFQFYPSVIFVENVVYFT